MWLESKLCALYLSPVPPFSKFLKTVYSISCSSYDVCSRFVIAVIVLCCVFVRHVRGHSEAVCCLFHHTTTPHAFNGPFPGLARWAGTRKVKPIGILLKQETVSGSGISWAICKSAPRCRQITTPAPHHSEFFTGRTPFLPPNQQRQGTEGNALFRLFICGLFRW